jgi:hypothetical protein
MPRYMVQRTFPWCRTRLSMRHAWRVGAAVAVLIAAGGLSAAQAAAKVTVQLRAFQGGPVLKAGSEVEVRFYVGNENGGCFQGWSATVTTNEAKRDTLTKLGAVEETCGYVESREDGVALSGTISELQFTTTGKLTAKVSKLALTETFCALAHCGLKYNCVYKLSKPSGTMSIPGELYVPLTVKAKLDTKESYSECATKEAFNGSAIMVSTKEGQEHGELAWAEDTA